MKRIFICIICLLLCSPMTIYANEIEVIIEPEKEWTKQVSVTLKPEDAYYTCDNENVKQKGNQFTITENGQYTFSSLEESKTITISNIDNISPVFKSGNEYSKQGREIKVNVEDSQSGIQRIELTTSNKIYTSSSLSFTLETSKEELQKIVAYDALGNQSIFYVNDDLNPGELTVNEKEDTYYVNGYASSIVYCASLGNSYNAEYAFSKQKVNVDDESLSYTTDSSFEIKENGVYYFYARNKGNGGYHYIESEEIKEIKVETIDVDGPDITDTFIQSNFQGNEYSNTEKGVTLSVEANDEGSGVDVYVLEHNGKEIEGNHSFVLYENGTYILTVKDKLGNCSLKKEIIVDSIDTLPPSISSASITYKQNVFSLFLASNENVKVVIPVEENQSGIDLNKTKLIVKDNQGNIVDEYNNGEYKEGNITYWISKKNVLMNLYFQSEDKVGNKLNEIQISYPEKDEKGNVLPVLIESNQPLIEETSKVEYQTIEGKDWLNHDEILSFMVSDSKVDDTYSGIHSIDVYINDELYSSFESKEYLYSKQIELDTSKLETKENGQIHIEIQVKDNADNETSLIKDIYMDTQGPVVTYSFDNVKSDSEYKNIYSQGRTMTIQVQEMNFDAASIQPSLDWTLVFGKKGCKDAIYQATIPCLEDGDYDIDISSKDVLGNEGDTIHESFIIDTTAPVIELSYDYNRVQNDKYYASNRIGTIRVIEEHFDPSRFSISGSFISNDLHWTSEGNVHWATFSCTKDDEYSIQLNGFDMAGNNGNSITDAFIIDTTYPEISISDVLNQYAYRGTVTPSIRCIDKNYTSSGTSLSLIGARKGSVSIESIRQSIEDGEWFQILDLAHIKENDDVYTLSVSVTDLAGNTSSKSITYSMNRFGSNYVLSNYVLSLTQQIYVQAIQQSLIIQEINIDELENIVLRYSMDGKVYECKKEKDYTIVHENINGCQQYTYQLNSSLFEKDGIYEIYLSSKDKAGNINENTMEQKESTIRFIVDSTLPTISITDIEDNGFYDTSSKEFTVLCEDNIELESVDVQINGKSVYTSKDTFEKVCTLKESNQKQQITVIAKDRAGNVYQREIKNVLVSTNWWIRFVQNTKLLIVSVIGLLILTCGILYVTLRKEKQEDNHVRSIFKKCNRNGS